MVDPVIPRPGGEIPELVWGDDNVVLDGVDFEVKDLGLAHSSGRLRLMKSRPMIERYVDLLTRLRPERIIELGIFQGGSTAFLAHLLRPEKLVAVDLSDRPVAPLDRFITDHGYESTVRPKYGVDQSDADALERILEEEFGNEPPDLVIDDASHHLDLTRQSFNILFPRLRPGGTYIIEDWAWGLFAFSPKAATPSMSVFIFELLFALPYASDMIAEVTVNEHWAAVRKAPESQFRGPWQIEQSYCAYARQIVDGATKAAKDLGSNPD